MSDSNPISSRVPPQALEAEQAVLGGILLDSRVVNEVSEIVEPGHFYRENHAQIYQAMLDLSAVNAPIDALTLQDRLSKMGVLEQVGGVEYLGELASRVPSAINAPIYATLIREKYILRGLITAGQTIVGEAYNEPPDVELFVDQAEQQIFAIAQQKVQQPFVPIKRIINEAIARIEKLEAQENVISGVPTGFYAMDKMMSGLQPDELIILAARPSMGKTSLALNMALNAALEHNKSIGFFSLEMSKLELTIRLLCSLGQVDSQRFRTGKLSDKEWMKLTGAADRLSRANIYIDDSAGQSEMAVRSKARRMQRQHGLDAIFIDYLQLMSATRLSRDSKREQEISQISRALKALAKELHVPVVALSQLNRDLEKRQDKRPIMSDLRESGAIEQDADVILFIHRDIQYDKEAVDKQFDAEVIIAKQRNGPTGKVSLRYVAEYTLFQNISTNEGPSGGYGGGMPSGLSHAPGGGAGYADEEPPFGDDDDMGY